MKKILTMLIALIMSFTCLGFAACDGNDGKTLYVYTKAGFAPYEFINERGQVVGVDIDIMKEIGDILGYQVVINDIAFNQILYEVTNNPYAIGAAGMTRTDARDEIALSSIPYATSTQYIITQKDFFDGDLVEGRLSISALAKMDIKSVGFQQGTTGEYLIVDAISGTTQDGQHVDGELSNKGFNAVGYNNAIVASQDIGTSLGAVIIDQLPAQSIVESNASLECYELDVEPEQYVLYLNKNATELLSKVNQVLEKMIDSGLIDYYMLKHSGGIIAR